MSLVNYYQFAMFKGFKYLNFKKLTFALILLLSLSYNSKAIDITKGIVGYWPLECSAKDTSGNSNNAFTFGNPTCDSGRINFAFHFNGKTDYLTLDSVGSQKYIDSSGFTWSLWFKGDALPKTKTTKLSQILISAMDKKLGEDVIFGFGDDQTEENVLSFRTDGNGGVGGLMQKTPKYAPVGGFKDSVWYHATGVCDFKNKKTYLYVDGIAVDSVNNNYGVLGRDLKMMIGVGNYDNTFQGFFAGMLDEIRIFNRALNADEVKYIYRLKANQLISSNKKVNFGNILSKKDSILNIDLTNLGPDEFKITSTKLSQGINYTILNGGNIPLQDGQVYPLSIKFNPVDSGSYVDTLIIENNQNVLPLKIYISGSKIINITLSKDTLTFADVIMCDNKAKGQVTLKITNKNEPDSLILTRIEFSNNVFEYNDKLPIKIGLNETKDIIFDFRPAGVLGSTPKSNAKLYFDSSYTLRNVYLKAVARNIELKQNQDSINYGKVIISNSKDTVINFANNGTAEFRIKNIILPNSVYFDVKKLPGKSPDSLLALDTIKLLIRYVGQAGTQYDSLEVQLENICGQFNKKYYLSAKGAYEALFDLYSVSDKLKNDTIINTSNNIKFPIIIKNPRKLKESEIKDISLDFTVNVTQLIPLETSKTFTQNGNYITYNLKFQIDNTKDYLIFYSPEFKVALGNKKTDTVRIGNFVVKDGFAKPNIINGTMTIGNVCQAGGTDRLIIINNALSLSSVKPNPVSQNINFDFEIIENGETKAILLNSKGELVKELFKENLRAGVYAKSVDMSEVPNGQYFLILKTPNQELFEQLQVVR